MLCDDGVMSYSNISKRLNVWLFKDENKAVYCHQEIDLSQFFSTDFCLRFDPYDGGRFAIATKNLISIYQWNATTRIIEKKYERQIDGIKDFVWGPNCLESVMCYIGDGKFCALNIKKNKEYYFMLENMSRKEIVSFDFFHCKELSCYWMHHKKKDSISFFDVYFLSVITRDKVFKSYYEVRAYRLE